MVFSQILAVNKSVSISWAPKKKMVRFITVIFIITLWASPSLAKGELINAYQLALKNSPLYNAANANYKASLEIKHQRRGAFFPQISLNAKKTLSEQDRDFGTSVFSGRESFESEDLSATVVQPIYHHDSYLGFKQATLMTQQASTEYALIKQQLITDITVRFFNVLSAQDNLELSRAEITAIKRQLEQIKQQFDVGLIAITDVHEAQAAFDLATANSIMAKNLLSNEKELMRELTGTLVETLPALGTSMPLNAPSPANVEHWIQLALSNNLNIKALQHKEKTSKLEVKKIAAELYPSMDLVANKTKSESDGGSFGANNSTNSSISIELTVPLFQGGITRSREREARQRHKQAAFNLAQQKRVTERLVRESYLNILADISRINALKQAVISNDSALKATEAGLEVGTRTTVEVLASRRGLFAAQRNLSRARYDFAIHNLSLKAATGILSSVDLEEIDSWLH